jgi:hypothetical protein
LRFFGGEVGKRIVLENEDSTVVICSLSEWNSAMKEKRRPDGIRVPIVDLCSEADLSLTVHNISADNT